MLEAVGKTIKGRRETNQDTFIIFHNQFDYLITIIADGMGGHKGGDVASNFAIEHIKKYLDPIDFTNKSKETIQHELITATKKVQNDFFKNLEVQPEYSDMGTTLNLNLFVDNIMYSLNVGDSRTSRFFKKEINPITEDHNLAALALKDPKYKAYINYTNLLTSSLGPTKETTIDVFVTPLGKKGYIIQTSDGVHNFLNNDDYKRILKANISLEAKSKEIIERAYANKSNDNLTVVVIQYGC